MSDSKKNEIHIKDYFKYSTKIEELRSLTGFKQYKLITGYRHSFFNYKDNYIALNKLLNNYYTIQKELFGHDIKRWHIQRKVIGNFQNVISSAQFFIEHLKKHKRKTGFENELIKEIESVFEKNELYDFLLVLRNFISHVQILPLISRRELKKDNLVFSSLSYESIDKSKIVEYLKTENKNNYKLAKSFLENSPKFINLNETLSKYDKLLSSFYEWFIKQFIIHNESSLLEMVEKNSEFHEFANKLGLSTDNPLDSTQIRYINYLVNKSKE